MHLTKQFTITEAVEHAQRNGRISSGDDHGRLGPAGARGHAAGRA